MPTVSYFLGLTILMFVNDHAPPHFHVYNAENVVKVTIETGEIENIKGKLSTHHRRKLLKWLKVRRNELLAVWTAVRNNKKIERIQPL
jgi:hypothetical protein